MLARHRIIFPDDHFLGHRTGVLLRHVEEASACSRVQADFDSCRFSHGSPKGLNEEKRSTGSKGSDGAVKER